MTGPGRGPRIGLVRKQSRPQADHWLIATLAALVAAALLPILYFLQVARAGPLLSPPMGDSVVYLQLAKEWARGGLAERGVFYWSPLYPVLLGLMGRGLLLGLQLVAGIGTVILAALAARRHGGPRAGFFAAAALALCATPVVYQVKLVPVTLATAFGMLGTVLVLAAAGRRQPEAGRRRANWWRWMLAGLCFGAAALLMPQLLLAAVIAAAGLVAFRPRRPSAALLVLAGAALAVVPVTVRNAVAGRDVVLLSHSGGFNFYIGNNPDASGLIGRPPEMAEFRPEGRELVTIPDQQEFQHRYAEHASGRRLKQSGISRFWTRRGLAWMASNPGRAGLLWLRKLLLSLTGYEFSDSYYPVIERNWFWPLRAMVMPLAVLLGLAAAGAVVRRRSGPDEAPGWPLFVVPLAVMVTLVVFFVNARFRLPAVPMLAVLAGVALDRGLAAGNRRRLTGLAVLLAVALGSGRLLPAAFRREMRYDQFYGWVNLSQNAEIAGDLEQAAALLDKAAGLAAGEQNEDLARARVWLGNRHLDRHELEAAARAYGLATQHDTTYAPAFLMRGVVDLMAGNAARALGYSTEALRRDPQMANGYVLRARALMMLGRRDEARAAGATARALDPQSRLVRELADSLGIGN